MKDSDCVNVGDLHSTAKGTGARKNAGKVKLSLVPLHLLGGAARVMEYGAEKYAPYNWAKGMDWSECMDCLLRHLFKWWYCREQNDPETGEHHLDHAMCNLLFLLHYQRTFTEGDNRPPEFADFTSHLMAAFVGRPKQPAPQKSPQWVADLSEAAESGQPVSRAWRAERQEDGGVEIVEDMELADRLNRELQDQAGEGGRPLPVNSRDRQRRTT